MSTQRIVVMTAAEEARANGYIILLFILAVIGTGIYTGTHWLFAETRIPLSQIDLTWSDDQQGQTEHTDAMGPDTVPSSHTLDLDIQNNSDYRLYSLSWRATLHVCSSPSQPVQDCPEVDSETGVNDPTVAPHMRGMHKLEIPWDNEVSQYKGYPRVDLELTDATGTSS